MRVVLVSAWMTVVCVGQTASISLERPLAVGMPVWLEVPARGPSENHYPFGHGYPGDFGCKRVEVRRDGQLLPTAGHSESFFLLPSPGNPCGSLLWRQQVKYPPRLPLHLLY